MMIRCVNLMSMTIRYIANGPKAYIVSRASVLLGGLIPLGTVRRVRIPCGPNRRHAWRWTVDGDGISAFETRRAAATWLLNRKGSR